MKARIPQALAPGALPAAARRITRACRTYRARRHCPEFELNERAAREFLSRSLRRHYAYLHDSEGYQAYRHEDWTLRPGWDLRDLYADETGTVENLVYYAQEAQVITCTHEGVGIDLIIESPHGGDWMYQWRVSFPSGARYAICSPWREEFRRLGWHAGDRDPKAKGCRTAMAVIREAIAYGNSVLDAHARAGGRIPARRRTPPGVSH